MDFFLVVVVVGVVSRTVPRCSTFVLVFVSSVVLVVRAEFSLCHSHAQHENDDSNDSKDVDRCG